MSVRRIVAYGDFNCPWSYLASRRAERLAADGVDVDWRAVEHAPPQPGSSVEQPSRLGDLVSEMDEVAAMLLPGEQLPYALAGFLPHTTAAVAGYAEAYGSGVSARVRKLLFEALWLHGFDLGDRSVVHTLLVDAVRSDSSFGKALPGWEYGGAAADQPSSRARRLLTEWLHEWHDVGEKTVPVVVVDDAEVLRGKDAIAWLGAELQARGVQGAPGGSPATAPVAP